MEYYTHVKIMINMRYELKVSMIHITIFYSVLNVSVTPIAVFKSAYH